MKFNFPAFINSVYLLDLEVRRHLDSIVLPIINYGSNYATKLI